MTNRITRPQIREVFLRNGFAIAPDRDDLEDRVYEAAFELLELTGHGEPVAWLYKRDGSESSIRTLRQLIPSGSGWKETPLYAAPQPAEQRSACPACMGSGIVGHSLLCPECEPVSDVSGLVKALEWITGADCEPGEGATDFAVAMGRGIAIGNIHRKAKAALAAYRKGGDV